MTLGEVGKILQVQDKSGKILENEWEVLVDASGHDERWWWKRLWDWWRGVEWKPTPITITLPPLSGEVFRIKKIDATDNPVIITTSPPTKLESQFEQWSNDAV